jgi:proteasome lid subunit RPN8/RPN11
MTLRNWFQNFLTPRASPAIAAPLPKLLLMQSCLDAVAHGLEPEISKGHEGIVYLLGRTDGMTALATTVFRPDAITAPGSFRVEPRAMAACVQAAGEHELQVAGQLHTHPGGAFHSDGDVEGARIRYPGYVSVVLPDYGRRLPSLSGMAAYMWRSGGWQQLASEDVIVIPGSGPWTGKTGTTGAMTGRSGTVRVV